MDSIISNENTLNYMVSEYATVEMSIDELYSQPNKKEKWGGKMKVIESEKQFYIARLNNYLALINQIYSYIDKNDKEMVRLKYKELKDGLKEDYHVYNTQRELEKISEYGKAMYYSLIMEPYVNINVSTNASLSKIKQAVIELELELRDILYEIERLSW